ncbi:MAG: polysaccharide deacetylase family protein [Bacteroidetes bacterium]|jgi:peptidoglycan/xylan/chitin deacetylase (PgdA/CDA1 family)|nr:polysaccharide deacetylase family protein [Bacteroidota bacterium]
MKHKIVTGIFIAALLLVGILYYNHPDLILFLTIIIVLYLAITAIGSYQIKLNYYINSLNHTADDSIALTFDDGPDPATTPQILEILKLANLKATFFIIGKNAEKYPELIKAINADGHIIGNHSYSHNSGIGIYSRQKLVDDVNRCSDTIEKITGVRPTIFRPPFGVTNPRYAYLLQTTGLKSIGWTIRSYDTTIENEKKLYNRITSQLKAGSIVLLHDTSTTTIRMLPALINYCNQNNLPVKPINVLTEQ